VPLRDQKKQPNGLVFFFSLVSSLPMSMAHTHTQKDKTPACCGPANCFCSFVHHQSGVWIIIFFFCCFCSLFFRLSCFPFPLPPKTHVLDMAANKIDTYFFGHAHTPTHTCLITKEKTSLPIPSFIKSRKTTKKPGKHHNNNNMHRTFYSRNAAHQLSPRPREKRRRQSSNQGDMSAFFSCTKLILGFIFN
jgi:hypothetical protein